MLCSSLYDFVSQPNLGSSSAVVMHAGMLSPGELQRLSFARVLLHNPQLCVMDEPVNAVGNKAGAQLIQLLQHQGIAAIMTCQRDSFLTDDALREHLFAQTHFL